MTFKERLGQWRQRRWVRWGMDLGVVLVLFAAVSAWQTRNHVRGVSAPDAPMTWIQEGRTLSLSELRGKPTLLVFWAPWCGVCKVQSPNVGSVKRLVGDKANVVSVATAYEDVADVRHYMAEQKVEYPVLLGTAAFVRPFQVNVYPTVYFLDSEGRVKGSVAGYTTTLGMIARMFLPL